MNNITLSKKHFLIFISLVATLTACKKSNPTPDPGPDPVKKPRVEQVNASVNTALSGKDTLSQFAAMYKSAGLTQAEVDAGITVFAPSNKAYTLKTNATKKVTAATDVYLPDSSVVRDYIVPQKIDIAKLASGASFNALSGKKLIITKVNDKWYLNGVFLNITVLSTGDNAVVFSVASLLNTSTLPHITGVSDVKTFPGWSLTIYGGNLGNTPEKNVVKIDGVAATIRTASADSIIITVPKGITNGVLTVTTNGRTVSAQANLVVQHAVVTKISGTGGGPIQGIAVDANDNLYWTDNFYNNNNVQAARLVKYSAGQISYYTPVFPNPNADGTNIPVLNSKTALWAIAANSQGKLFFATEAYPSTAGYNGIYLANASAPNTAEWWTGMGASTAATTKNNLKVYTTAISVDKQDNLYLFNGGDLQKITPAGVVSTAISGQQFINADATVKVITSSYGVITTGSKTYLSDNTNGRIWLKDDAGLRVIAGNNTHIAKDGVGSAAQFGSPFGIVLDKKGNLYVCDNDYGTSNFIIRMINPYGEVTTIAGGAGAGTDIDGTGTAAGFNGVNCITIDSKGTLYVGTDAGTVRKITFQ